MKTRKYKAVKVKSQIVRETDAEGVSIEEQIRKIIAEGAPIDNTAPIMYTPEKDGVLPECDPRTDRWELALDATSKYDKSERAKSENTPIENAEESNENQNGGGEEKTD